MTMIATYIPVLVIILTSGTNALYQNGPAAHQPQMKAAPHNTTADSVKKVHIVFMNHLDVGYGISPTVGFINNVINKYFHDYFPRAHLLGQQLREGGYKETFVYTTHPWLVQLYLNCPPNLTLANVTLKCPTATEKAAFTTAVEQGVITWHAGPMNMQIEFMTPWLLEYGLNISQQLDKYFKITRPLRVLSQRDVPGMTQAVIPYLAKMNIAGVSVGVNPMTAPPALPKLFRWQYDKEEVLATWHPGGYPNNPGSDPAHPGGLSINDCAIAPPPVSEALCFAFRTDNSGPPVGIHEVIGYYDILREQFPSAKLQASTLENFMQTLQPIRAKLPVITQEVGDTWIQGVASDPRKSADYRAVARVMGQCLQQGNCSFDDSRVWNASMFLVKLPEHTWGLPSVHDTAHWTNEELRYYRHSSNYNNCSLSWQEQRMLIDVAVSALADHPVVTDIKKELSNLVPSFPNLQDYDRVDTGSMTSSQWTCGAISKLSLASDGSIDSLTYKQVIWASRYHPLSQVIYQTFDQTDFANFGKYYNYNGGSAGYTKNNMTASAHPQSRSWPVTMTALYAKQAADGGCDLWAHVEMLEKKAWLWYGAPADLWLRYKSHNLPHPGLDIELQWFDKTSTRLPEAIYLAFSPVVGNQWQMSKLGFPVDPQNVYLNGSQYQHVADDNGVYVKPGMQVSSLDVPIVCPITDVLTAPHVFPAPLEPIKANITGMAFNLYNNIWDTNYILWYPYLEKDKDFKARFSVNFF